MESARYQLMLLTRLKHNKILERHKASLRPIGDLEDCRQLISLHLDSLNSVPTDGILLSLYPVESFFRRRNSVNELCCVEVSVRFDQGDPLPSLCYPLDAVRSFRGMSIECPSPPAQLIFGGLNNRSQRARGRLQRRRQPRRQRFLRVGHLVLISECRRGIYRSELLLARLLLPILSSSRSGVAPVVWFAIVLFGRLKAS